MSPSRHSPDLLENLIEAAPDAMVVVNSAGKILLVNRQAEALFGYRRSELIDRRVEMLVPEASAHNHVAVRERFSQFPSLRPMGAGSNLKGRRKDGAEIAIDIMLSPVDGASGIAIIATVRDATARQLAADKLETSEAMFRALHDQSPDAIIAVDRRGCIVQCNQKVQEMFGYESAELLGKEIEVLVPKRFRQNHVAQRVAYTARPHSRPMGAGADLLAMRKDGFEFPVDILLSPVQVPGGDVVISVVRDVTERKAAARLLTARAEQLSRSNQELEQFAYVASHDLQEPLRAVASSCQVLQRKLAEKLDEDSGEFLQFAVDGAKRMQDLINDLLTLSRAGRSKPFECVEMSLVLERALANLGSQIHETKASISADALPSVGGDFSQLVQLFQNLISNGMKFCSGVAPVIRVSVTEAPESWTFSIKDNGIGIPQDYQHKIFVIFQRLHRQDQYPGTGIGLAICKKIVESHDGKIWIESVAGAGSTFSFTLPKRSKQE